MWRRFIVHRGYRTPFMYDDMEAQMTQPLCHFCYVIVIAISASSAVVIIIINFNNVRYNQELCIRHQHLPRYFNIPVPLVSFLGLSIKFLLNHTTLSIYRYQPTFNPPPHQPTMPLVVPDLTTSSSSSSTSEWQNKLIGKTLTDSSSSSETSFAKKDLPKNHRVVDAEGGLMTMDHVPDRYVDGSIFVL